MICWLLGWQQRGVPLPAHMGGALWRPVVYGAIPDILPGEPCKPTLVTPHKEEVTCTRCREAQKKRGLNAVDFYLKSQGLPGLDEPDQKP